MSGSGGRRLTIDGGETSKLHELLTGRPAEDTILEERPEMHYELPDEPVDDPCSFSRTKDVAVTHYQFNLTVDFKAHSMRGEAILTCKLKNPTHSYGDIVLVLDTWKLCIESVRDADDPHHGIIKHTLGDHKESLGSMLQIPLDKSRQTCKLLIKYKTTPDAPGCVWVPPEKTMGKKFPFFFTKSQYINSRSLFPCQDTPSNRATWDAKVHAPLGLTVVMSGERYGTVITELHAGEQMTTFRQQIPMPSNQFAMVVGELKGRDIGPRSKVFAEPGIVEKATFEFADAERMISAGEKICGPFIWGSYYITVLPVDMDFNALENASLTFVSPMLLAGNRSLSVAIARQIASNWAGMGVCAASFEHMWLNDGMAAFVERRILSQLYGEEMRLFTCCRGLRLLKEDIARAKPALTRLVMDLKNVHPQSVLTSIPAEKGHAFLWHLEKLVSPTEFTKFLQTYFKTNQCRTITSEAFENYFKSCFTANSAIKEVKWQAWLHGEGLPPVLPDYSNTLENKCIELKSKWLAWQDSKDGCSFRSEDLAGFIPLQIQEFLDFLVAAPPLSVWKLKAMDKVYGTTFENSNAEILCSWLGLCARGRLTSKLEPTLNFIKNYCTRARFMRMLFSELGRWKDVHQSVTAVFRQVIFDIEQPTSLYIAELLQVDTELEVLKRRVTGVRK